MDLWAFWMQNGGTILAAVILASPQMLVLWRQSTNSRRLENIDKTAAATHHEITNGLGNTIAKSTIDQIKPVLAAQTKDIAKNAEVVAAKLVETKTKDSP